MLSFIEWCFDVFLNNHPRNLVVYNNDFLFVVTLGGQAVTLPPLGSFVWQYSAGGSAGLEDGNRLASVLGARIECCLSAGCLGSPGGLMLQ